MKLGVLISMVLVVFLGLLGFFAYWGVADPPTAATSPVHLEKMVLPTDLSPIFIPSAPQGDAARVYDRVLDLYQDHRDTFMTEDYPPTSLTNAMVSLMIEAMQQEKVKQGFLDDHIPVQPGATPDFQEALEAIPELVLIRADEMYREGNTALAISATRAVWALGQRAFQNNQRLYNRAQGLTIMLDAGEKLLSWISESRAADSDNVRQWMKTIHETDKVWRTKYELTARLRPHIGDLLNIARNDNDISFRVAATLQLGVAKFNPGGRGNRRVILSTIEQAKSSSDPLVVQAGIAAARMTPEQLRKIY